MAAPRRMPTPLLFASACRGSDTTSREDIRAAPRGGYPASR
jgi:hypothetical protein